MNRIALAVLGIALLGLPCLAQLPTKPDELPPPPTTPHSPIWLPSPAPAADRRVLPINLATALQLACVRPIDVAVAAERVQAAAAVLDQARAVWLPTLTLGGDYARHDGQIQDAAGNVFTTSRSNLMFGAGSGFGTSAVFSLNDALFGPLAARQTLQAREAEVQTAANNSLVAVTDAYFTVEQARGELAGALDSTRRTRELILRVEKLAAGLVPPLEVVRAQAELARREQAELVARERWQVASADLTRVLRLEATAQVEPLEPASLRVVVIDPNQSVDDLVVVGLVNRPELASNQSLVQATLTLLRQEKLRPLVPSVILRGWSTPVAGTLAAGVFAGGTNDKLTSTGLRGDIDVQVLWQLDNLGFGNRARIRQRESDHQVAILELFRTQDRVAAEVAQAHAQARQSALRAAFTEREVKLSLESFEKNLIGLGQTRRAGELIQTVVRPQEVLAAVQALAQAYANHFQAVADCNRGQFRLYRALGHPAQLLAPKIEATCPAPPSTLPTATPWASPRLPQP